MRSTAIIRFGTLAACAAGMAGPVFAQPVSPAQALLDQRFVANIGAFIVQTDIKARLDGSSPGNPEIDFDRTLGETDDSTRVRADLLWRITPKHHLSFMYFDNSNTRTKVLDETVNWGDNVYAIGATVKTDTEFKVGALSYEYAFLREPSYEVTASIGVHVSDMTLTLSGDGSVNGAPVAKVSQSNSVTAPLPVIGLRGSWVVAPQVLVGAQGNFFKLKVDEVDGYWSDIRVSATWMFNKNFGVGLGYDRYFNNVEVTKNSFNGRVKFGYSGLQAYLTGSF